MCAYAIHRESLIKTSVQRLQNTLYFFPLVVFLLVVVVFTYFFLSVVYLSFTLSVVSTCPVVRQRYIFRNGRRLTYAAVRTSDDSRCLVFVGASMVRCIDGRYIAWCSVDEDASPISSPRWTLQVHGTVSSAIAWAGFRILINLNNYKGCPRGGVSALNNVDALDSPVAIQIDKTTDKGKCAQVMAYVRYLWKDDESHFHGDTEVTSGNLHKVRNPMGQNWTCLC